MEDKARLGRLLVESNLVTEEQLRMATDFQRSVGGNLGAIVVKLGFIEDHRLIQFIAKDQGLSVITLDDIVLPHNLVRRLPRKLIEKHQVLPIHYKDNILTVATADPYDYEAIEEIQLAQDSKIEINLAPRSAIQKCITELFHVTPAPMPVTDREEAQAEAAAAAAAHHDVPITTHRHLPKVSKLYLHEALIPLLIQKGVISEEELIRKAREIEAAAGGR
jgi:type II secretory ATPase GspE/PulE/Tfp pilus assembly ATPase PilB-like protein